MMLFNDTVSFSGVCRYLFNGHAGMLSDETLNPGPMQKLYISAVFSHSSLHLKF